MLSKIFLYNFSQNKGLEALTLSASSFVLATCQRTLVLSLEEITLGSEYVYEKLSGEQAYAYLLEIICGLKSKLIGENEIVSQFKAAYKTYSESTERSSHLMIVLEKLFQDSKDIRTKYLIGLSQKTYSSLARKIVVSKHHASEVLIIGSGQMAEDMINQLKKKVPVAIVARNQARVSELATKHDIRTLNWSDIDQKEYQCLNQYAHIINTIGSNDEILNHKFFDDWKQSEKRCFVDLADRSPYKNAPVDDQNYYQLDDIFELGAVHEKEKSEKVEEAKIYLEKVAEKRSQLLAKKMNLFACPQALEL